MKGRRLILCLCMYKVFKTLRLFTWEIFRLHNFFCKQKMVEITSKSYSEPLKSAFLLFSFLLLVNISTTQVSARNRCDYQKAVTYWTSCRECSIIRHYRCHSAYIQTSGANGTRSCKTTVHFGSGFGSVSVQGCQHTCVMMETFKKCCDGFWGSECKGMQTLKGLWFGVCMAKIYQHWKAFYYLFSILSTTVLY